MNFIAAIDGPLVSTSFDVLSFILYVMIPFSVSQLSLLMFLFPNLFIKYEQEGISVSTKVILSAVILHAMRIHFIFGAFTLLSVSKSMSEIEYLLELLIPFVMCFISLLHSLFYLWFRINP